MDVEQPPNQIDRMIDEPIPETDNSWLLFGHKPTDLFKCTFHCMKQFFDEQQGICKLISSRSFFSKACKKSIKKSQPNELLVNPPNLTGNTYQTFIPNKVYKISSMS